MRQYAIDRPGWTVGQSIALELDAALSIINGYLATDDLPPELAALLHAIPADWKGQAAAFLESPGRIVSLLSDIARLADVLLDENYERASGAMRELTIEAALAGLTQEAQVLGLHADTTLTPDDQLLDLWRRVGSATYRMVDLEVSDQAERQVAEFRQAMRFLREGDLHPRFWHWLDRFYYGWYQPWRATRVPFVEQLSRQAMAELGADVGAGATSRTGWLPAQSPLLRLPELQRAVADGRLHLFLWAEPFGLADMWLLVPGLLAISFAEPGPLYESFKGFADDVATRAKALSDPTRLVILRIIRHFGMINTDIAEYLELARPTVSIHAKILREAGLIRSRQEGRLVRHEIVADEVRRLLRDLERFLDLPPEERL